MFYTFAFCSLCFCCLVGVFADTDAVKSVSVMEGDSVTLNSSLTEMQRGDRIMWTFGTNGPYIAKTDGVKNTIPDNLDGRFRDRLKLDKKTGSLTIMNIRTEHAGVYEVKISRSSSPSTYRFTVTVYAATTPDPHTPSGPPSGSPSHPPLSPASRTPSGPASGSSGPSSGSSGPSSGPASGSSGSSGSPSGPVSLTALISTAAAAAGFLVIVAAIGMIWICKKHRKTDQEVETRDEEITYADPTFYKRNTKKSQEDEVVYAAVVTRR